MTDAVNTTGNSEPTNVHIAGAEGALSVRDAMRSVVDWRRKQTTEDGEQRTDASAATAATPPQAESTAQAEDAAPASEQPSGETESQAEPAEQLPPIEP